MDHKESPFGHTSDHGNTGSQAAWALELLRGSVQQQEPVGVLPPCLRTGLQVVESSQPATELHMGTPHRYTGTVWNTEAAHNGKGTEKAICIYLTRTGAEVVNVQSEEPGAGKLHAGICAGGAPKGAFLPR